MTLLEIIKYIQAQFKPIPLIEGDESSEVADEAIGSAGVADYSGTFTYYPVEINGVTIKEGSTQTVTDDGNGNLIGDVDESGVNTIDYITGDYNVSFAAVTSEAVTADYSTDKSIEGIIYSIKDALRFFNKYNGNTHYIEKDFNGEEKLTLPTPDAPYKITKVVKVYPDQKVSIWATDLRAQLLGVNYIDVNFIDHLILKRTHQAMRKWASLLLDFDHYGDYLLIHRAPTGTSKLFIRYIYGYTFANDMEIVFEDDVDFILRYASILTMIKEGRILLKSEAVDLKVGGPRLEDQGYTLKKELEEEFRERQPIALSSKARG